MSLKERLLQDMKEALKEKDTVRKDIIQIIRAGVLQVEKDNKIILDDSGVIDVLLREIKKINDVMPDYQKRGNQDLIDKINKQLLILKDYLPKQLSNDEIKDIINEAINQIGASSLKDMGNVMKNITHKVKGLADTRLVSEMVKELLSK